MGIFIEYIPDGHAYYISVFRNNASATVFKMESQNLCTYANFDRLFSFLVFSMKFYISLN
jgi:hypothetical protein